MSTKSVAETLADTPRVRNVVQAAAAAARGIEGSDTHAMTHSWVLTGPPGSGRSVVAQAFAQALVCENVTELGCGRCQSCRDVGSRSHTDVEHVVPQGNVIPVKFVREHVIPTAHSLPTVAPWRVIIIEDADRLQIEAANTLLKTIEEPPVHTVLLLCAPSLAPEDFIPTLRSRCRHLYVPSPSTERITRLLVEEGASEQAARLAATSTLHHIGRARKLATTPTMQKRRAQAINLAELVFHGGEAFQAVNSLVSAVKKEVDEHYAPIDETELKKLEGTLGVGAKGKGAQKSARSGAGAVTELQKEHKRRRTRAQTDFLDLALVDLAGIYRDAMLLGAEAKEELTHPDFEPLARELAERGDLAALVEAQAAIRECRERLRGFVAPQLALDGMIGRIRIAFKAR